jgi:hypothetical protein
MVVIYRNRRCFVEERSSGERILKSVKSVKGRVKQFKASIHEELVEISGLIVKDGRVLRVS